MAEREPVCGGGRGTGTVGAQGRREGEGVAGCRVQGTLGIPSGRVWSSISSAVEEERVRSEGEGEGGRVAWCLPPWGKGRGCCRSRVRN